MKPLPLSAASAALALFVSMLWGGNVVAIKLGLGAIPPFWSAFWRFLAAAPAVYLWARLRGAPLAPEPGESRALWALAAMFAAQICCLNVGVQATSPAYAVVLLNSHPVFTNLYGHFFASEEKLTAGRLLGLALSVAGMVVVAVGDPDEALAPRPLLGAVLTIVSANLLALRVIQTRRMVQSMHPVKPVFWQMMGGLPMFLAAAAVFEPPTLQPLDWRPVAAILYQGPVIGGFCFICWTTLLRTHSAGSLSLFGFTVPFFGVALSLLLFGEKIGGHLIAGAALVTAGILVATRRRPARPADIRETEVVEISPSRPDSTR